MWAYCSKVLTIIEIEAEEAVEDAMNDCLVETSLSVPSVSLPSFMPAKLVSYLCQTWK